MSLQTLVKSQCKSTNKYYSVQYEVLVVYNGEQMLFPFKSFSRRRRGVLFNARFAC